MKFKLQGRLLFSSDLSKLPLEDLGKLLDEANRSLLVKGAPPGREDEAAKVSKWEVHDNVLSVEIVSGRLVRAHDALLRLRKYLAQELGKKYKIGVRRLEVPELEVKIPTLSVDVDQIRKELGNAIEVRADEGSLTLLFKDLKESDLEDRVVDRAIRLIQPERIEIELKGKFVPFGYVLKASPPKKIIFTGEVAETAERLGWIKRFPARGQWILTAPMASLVSAIRSIIVDYICKPLGFQEWIFPRLIPFAVLEKLSTYVEHLPEGMFYVCAPPRDPRAFEEFKREFKLRRTIRSDLLRDILEPPSYVLDAVQCPPFYQFFSGEIVRVEDLPIKVYDYAGGWTWRNEAGGVEGLARTNEFLRLEMVYLGSPDQVVELRDRVVERTLEVVDKILELEWRLTVGAPFYLSQEAARKKLVDISESSKIPALDIECYLPYRGDRESSEWLEISACNIHMRHYVEAFKIKEVKGRELWTGCVGHGLTRWATALLAQKGFNFDEWPHELKRRIGELPPPVKTVTWP